MEIGASMGRDESVQLGKDFVLGLGGFREFVFDWINVACKVNGIFEEGSDIAINVAGDFAGNGTEA